LGAVSSQHSALSSEQSALSQTEAGLTQAWVSRVAAAWNGTAGSSPLKAVRNDKGLFS